MTLLQLYKGDKFMTQADYNSSAISGDIEWRVMAKNEKGALVQNTRNHQLRVMKQEIMVVKMK